MLWTWEFSIYERIVAGLYVFVGWKEVMGRVNIIFYVRIGMANICAIDAVQRVVGIWLI